MLVYGLYCLSSFALVALRARLLLEISLQVKSRCGPSHMHILIAGLEILYFARSGIHFGFGVELYRTSNHVSRNRVGHCSLRQPDEEVMAALWSHNPKRLRLFPLHPRPR